MFFASKTWKNFFHNGNPNFPTKFITTAKKNNWTLFLSLLKILILDRFPVFICTVTFMKFELKYSKNLYKVFPKLLQDFFLVYL